jgi:hypothetical protein
LLRRVREPPFFRVFVYPDKRGGIVLDFMADKARQMLPVFFDFFDLLFVVHSHVS